jgi:Sec-independent protein translocase protein TatA
MAKGLGEGIRNFKQTMKEEDPKPVPAADKKPL